MRYSILSIISLWLLCFTHAAPIGSVIDDFTILKERKEEIDGPPWSVGTAEMELKQRGEEGCGFGCIHP